MKVAALLFLAALQAIAQWPALTQTSRPWAYWWWMGSAADPVNITRQLEQYKSAGLGGVHIIPIYGAVGYESRYVPYLSPQWMGLLRHTVLEAKRLGLGVDMSLGTGWCFGGPQITEQLAAARAVPVRTGSPSGPTITSVGQKPAIKVKRSAPGGEGWMLNPFMKDALDAYLPRFQQAFDAYDGPKPRAVYHDSFEYGADWSPQLMAEFEKRRGYSLQDELNALFGADASEHAARVKSDYRETLSDLLLDNFTQPWADWSRRNGFLTRDQAHGSPANLLDLYGAVDIPETEMFNRDRSSTISRFASSAAHVNGRNLVSSETGTWIKEHFNETLADLKNLLDQLFLSGVNHVFYHGTAYSPADAPWPGWVFYASTQMNPRTALWHDAPALNAYIARSQSMLQSGMPSNDVLVYWPVYDVWEDSKGLAKNFTVHNRAWVEDMPFGHLAKTLQDRGYAFDFISDRQLAAAKVQNGQIILPGGFYKTLLIPATNRMPVATLKRIHDLARAGAVITFEDRLPADVPGAANLEARRAEFQQTLNALKTQKILIGPADQVLTSAGARREPLADIPGLQFIRRRTNSGDVYFVANRGTSPIEQWVPFNTKANAALLLDPMTARTGAAASRRTAAGLDVYLQLDPGQTIFVQAQHTAPAAAAWAYAKPAAPAKPLEALWAVRFIDGGPEIPPPFKTDSLTSWTAANPVAERFAGTALYSTYFDSPGKGDWLLDLGDVRESARVRLNGVDMGTLFTAPFSVRLTGLKPGKNLLEIEVTNTTANRIRDLDRRGVQWHQFHDIDFVNIDYKPFNASNWPIRPSGLLGPVTLRPLDAVTPGK